MVYDKLGRITEKLLDSTTVIASYTYDTAPGKGMGQLASVEGDKNISYSFEYDDLGRLKKETENIQGRSFITETGYNTLSQVNQVKYPETGYAVGIEYQNGYIRTVNGTENIFTATSYNQRGQLSNYTLGNGLTAALGYDDYGFPASVSIPGIQNHAYHFNAQTGNLNWREDISKNLKEEFSYDNVMKNRLETWQVNTGPTYGVDYSVNGNIIHKTGIGTFSYEPARPHAVSEIENTGNLVSQVEQAVRYTPFNKVDTIHEGNYRLEITYGPDQARKITRLYNNNVLVKTKYYAGGNYEVEIDASGNERKLHYIYGSDGLAAILVKTNTAQNLYYIHKDHLGSFTAVTDASGAKVEEMSFDPWGRRRNPANWTFDNMASSYLFDRGYTGHEHLDEFSLINMNGRVYDPILGRFMSPDNYIQAPDYTQNFNRYSYALNNPLVYTDPSGEFWEYILVAAYFYLKTAHENRNPETGKWAWNPIKWFNNESTVVVGINTNTEFSDVTGYVGVGSGYYLSSLSYNNNYGLGTGYWSPQGASFAYPGANHNRPEEVVNREISENQLFEENGLLPPVDLKFPITSPYKEDNRIIPELGLNRPHLAIDIGTPVGTPILSPWSGTVTMAQDTKYGLSVIVQHDYLYNGSYIQTGYAHLSKINMHKGLQLLRGDTIGYSGDWGTGPHLHFTLRFGDKKVNPTILFPYK